MINGQLIDMGIGTVAADKNDGSRFIWVFPNAQLPYHEGAITHDVVDINKKGLDHEGNQYSATIQRSGSIKAEWLKSGNRLTSPNIRKGESVKLFAAADTDTYYWEELGRTGTLRRAEKITYAFNADSEELTKDKPVTGDNHYSLTIDGQSGTVTFNTTRANGEKASYTIQINGKDGQLSISDHNPIPNIIQIDSTTDTITASNGKGSFISLAKDIITLHAKKQIILDSPDIKMNASNSVDMQTPNTAMGGKLNVATNIQTPNIKGQLFTG